MKTPTSPFNGHPDQRYGHISYAQHGDDFMILNLFELIGIEKPSYLDLGAHHPTIISNTKLLYDRGSSGVNVEANPNLIERFNEERPRDVNVNCGVSDQAGEFWFFMYSQSSGRNTFSTDEIKTLENIMTVKEKILVKTKTVNQIVEEYCGGKWPDLLSCDIEGLDYDVMNSADFSLSAPKIICVETRRHEAIRMIKMLTEKGYEYCCRMGENIFFVHTKYCQKIY